MELTAFDLAQRYTGIQELPGGKNHPLIQWWLSLCGFALDSPDEIPWCSAFVNGMAWQLSLPRTKSAVARSWLGKGVPVPLDQAQVGFDVVIIQRGTAPQPGPEVLNASGHVGFFAGWEGDFISILGGNQGNAVTVDRFNRARLLGVRRLV